MATRIAGPFTVISRLTSASLTTALTGTNNDLTITADAAGEAANAIRVRYVNPGTASQALGVTVAGNDITVNLATSAGSAITSTGAQVRDAINAHGGASALVTAANAEGNDGTGVVTAMGYTNLSGGLDYKVGRGSPYFKSVRR